MSLIAKRNNRIGKTVFAGIAALLLLLMMPLTTLAAEQKVSAAEDVTIVLDGTEVKLSDPARVAAGRLYLPVAQVARMFGAQVDWDQDNEEATLHTATGNTIILGNGVPVFYFNGDRYLLNAAPITAEGRLYVPLRDAAELLQAKASWNAEERVARLESPQEADDATVKVKAAAKKNDIGFEEAQPYTPADLQLLARITQVEAGNESYESQLAVANVILNRVKDSRFPDTIRDVIYSGKQFPPAHNGLLDKTTAKATALRAAKDALNGKNNVADAVYFYNPQVTKGEFWSSLTVVGTVGSHRYAK